MRLDLDIPVQDGVIVNDTRLQRSLATIEYLTQRGAKVVLCGHRGAPTVPINEPELTLAPIATQLSLLLNQTVSFAPDTLGTTTSQMVTDLHEGSVMLLENLQFHAGEADNDPAFVTALASLADIYVNDDFTSANQAYASTRGLAAAMPTATAVVGLSVQKELQYLQQALIAAPGRPFTAILHSPSLSASAALIEALLPRVDTLVLGGAMVFTMFQARGVDVTPFAVEEDQLSRARDFERTAAQRGIKIYLSNDLVLSSALPSPSLSPSGVGSVEVESWQGVALGSEKVVDLQTELASSKTILWAGVGDRRSDGQSNNQHEVEPLSSAGMTSTSAGVEVIARAVAGWTELGCVSVVVGEEVAAAVKAPNVTHISSDASVVMDVLIGRPIPGFDVIEKV